MQEHWSTYDREGFEVELTFRRLKYKLACGEDVLIFTGKRTLLFYFYFTAMEPGLDRHKVLKVNR